MHMLSLFYSHYIAQSTLVSIASLSTVLECIYLITKQVILTRCWNSSRLLSKIFKLNYQLLPLNILWNI